MTDFDQFIEAIKHHMQPAGRAQHLADMLQQLSAFTPADTTLADLALGWELLALPRTQNEEAPVAHRRDICAKLYAVAAPLTSEPGDRAGAVKTWQAWYEAFRSSTDPRQTAMAKTLARELTELQSAPG